MNRISRDEMHFMIAKAAAKRGTCLRKRIGAVIVPQRGILVVGYNGAPSGQPHCLDVGCLIDEAVGGCIRTQHAEMNAIAWAARSGIALEGAVLYTTISPCLACAKAIVTAGIERVKYIEEYRDVQPLDYLFSAGIGTEGFSCYADSPQSEL